MECGFSIGNIRKNPSPGALPALTANNTLALTGLSDEHHNDDPSSTLPHLFMVLGATLTVGASMAFGYWLGRKAHNKADNQQEDIDSSSLSSIASVPLTGSHQDVIVESEIS